MKVLLVFVDGFGLGDNDPNTNPLVRYHTSFFKNNFSLPLTRDIGKVVSARSCLIPLDARLEVDGLPQSATGQTTLFTGVNAARKMGRHIQAFPGPQLTQIIHEHGIMKQIIQTGLTATSANMYTPNYLDLVQQRKRRHSATTLLILGAGLPLRSVPEMEMEEAVYQDITNETLPLFGVETIKTIRPAEAARRLIRLAQTHHFTLFEYFQTDRCGHKNNWDRAQEITAILDEFFVELQAAAPRDLTVLITSDHGNFEDFSTKTHTLNPIPLIIFGDQCERFAEQIYHLTDIAPTILSMLKGAE